MQLLGGIVMMPHFLNVKWKFIPSSLPKPSIFHQSYSIDANTIQGLLIYFCLRVLKWLVAYLFKVCGVLIKFLLKKWTFGAKNSISIQYLSVF